MSKRFLFLCAQNVSFYKDVLLKEKLPTKFHIHSSDVFMFTIMFCTFTKHIGE